MRDTVRLSAPTTLRCPSQVKCPCGLIPLGMSELIFEIGMIVMLEPRCRYYQVFVVLKGYHPREDTISIHLNKMICP